MHEITQLLALVVELADEVNRGEQIPQTRLFESGSTKRGRTVPSQKYIVLVIVLFWSFVLGTQGPFAAKLQDKSSEDLIVITLEIPARQLLNKPEEKSYRVGDKPYIKVIAKNNSDQRIRVRAIDPYYQNRPTLFKNGQLVAYRKQITELIHSKDMNPEFISLRQTFSLEAYSSADLPELDLNDWYGPLEPGSYRLINRYRREIYGSWTVDSAPLLFEVVEQRP